MAVGSIVVADLDSNLIYPDTAPHIVWEWLVVEALIREMDGEAGLWGVPGTNVARRAIREFGYIDTRSYLKTPRIFGFHGVYKRLAVHLGVCQVDLGPGPAAEELADAWARGIGFRSLKQGHASTYSLQRMGGKMSQRRSAPNKLTPEGVILERLGVVLLSCRHEVKGKACSTLTSALI